MKKLWGLGKKDAPRSFIAVAQQGTVMKGESTSFSVKGRSVAVVRSGDDYYAFDDTCTHRQCELSKGFIRGTAIVCPCHGSEFDIKTGQVLKGPATAPVNAYQVRIEAGNIEIEA